MKKMSTGALRDAVIDYRLGPARDTVHTTEFAAIRKAVNAMSFNQLCIFAKDHGILADDTEVGMSSDEANDVMQRIVDEFGTVSALSRLASAVAYVVHHYPEDVEAANFAKRIIALADEIDEFIHNDDWEEKEGNALPGQIASEYEKAKCPDCGKGVPLAAQYGEACATCGHVWNRPQEAEG